MTDPTNHKSILDQFTEAVGVVARLTVENSHRWRGLERGTIEAGINMEHPSKDLHWLGKARDPADRIPHLSTELTAALAAGDHDTALSVCKSLTAALVQSVMGRELWTYFHVRTPSTPLLGKPDKAMEKEREASR